MVGASVFEQANSSGISTHDSHYLLGQVVATACLVWYAIVVTVAAIGYVQLCVNMVNRTVGVPLKICAQVPAFLETPSPGGDTGPTSVSAPSYYHHPPGQGCRTSSLRMLGCHVSTDLPFVETDRMPLRGF